MKVSAPVREKPLNKAVFRPRTMGVFILLIVILAFAAYLFRNELVLFLVAAVFLCVWLYGLVFTLFFALLNRKRARLPVFKISPARIAAGEETAVRLVSGGRFFRFPAILVRCAVNLQTKDGRLLRHVFEPGRLKDGMSFFTAPERGAYYSPFDEVMIMDSLGFFCFSYRNAQDGDAAGGAFGGAAHGAEARLLVMPRPAVAASPVNARSGGEEQRTEFHYLRTDNLIEHRPYVPGDDPRRINWKLYSHNNELFVRQGEPEPPPHARLTIFIDTQADPALYSRKGARQGVDLLCEYALSAALDCIEKGMEITLAWIGGAAAGRNAAELAAALAYPAALSLDAPGELFSSITTSSATAGAAETGESAGFQDRGCLVLALPRGNFAAEGNNALDRFLQHYGSGKRVELLFLYEDNAGQALREAGTVSASFYGQRPGIQVRLLQCGRTGGVRHE